MITRPPRRSSKTLSPLVLLAALTACQPPELRQAPPSSAATPAPKLAHLTLSDVNLATHMPLLVEPGRVHVLIFVTQDCPIANSYAPEISRIRALYAASPVHFFVVHTDPSISVNQARQHAKDYGHECTVLLDPHHRLVGAVSATVSPEAVVIVNKDPGASSSQTYAVHYQGRIDNLYTGFGQRRAVASAHNLRAAIDTALAGTPVNPAKTKAVGCYLEDLR